MSKKENTFALVTIDIETIPSQDTYSFKEPTLEDIGEHGSLKDPEKIAKWKEGKLAELRAKRMEEAEKELRSESLVSYKGRILCISYAIGDGAIKTLDSTVNKKYFEAEEARMLWDFYNDIKDYKTVGFVGCNVIQFDLPFILHRAFRFGVKQLANIIRVDNGYSKGRDWDIMEMFYGGLVWKPRVSLENMCNLLGISTPKNEMRGSEVFDYYLKGEIDKIRTYCEKDVDRARRCYYRLK